MKATTLVLLWALAAAACSTGSDMQTSTSATLAQCPFMESRLPSLTAPACLSCISAMCGAQSTSCYGQFLNGGSSGGTCGNVLPCLCRCGATDSSCLGACQTPECVMCDNGWLSCAFNNCADPCSQPPPPDMATSGGGGCAQLQQCCSQLTLPQMQQQCNSAVNTNNDMACSAALVGYQSGGLCN